MAQHPLIETFRAARIVPVIRTSTAARAATAVEWLKGTGITIFEITLTIPDALSVIRDVAADPALLRMLFVEILGLGLTGLAVRRETNLRIASFIQAAAMSDETPLMSERLAMTVVGGINELILQAVEQGLPQDLRELVAPSTQLIFAVARDGARRIAAEG